MVDELMVDVVRYRSRTHSQTKGKMQIHSFAHAHKHNSHFSKLLINFPHHPPLSISTFLYLSSTLPFHSSLHLHSFLLNILSHIFCLQLYILPPPLPPVLNPGRL